MCNTTVLGRNIHTHTHMSSCRCTLVTTDEASAMSRKELSSRGVQELDGDSYKPTTISRPTSKD